ncbi:DUF2480 family protein [Sphingobacterium bovistauri]|uniref:DUF2480 family protein n=1 Tax=Sphingobacterium bovistauri TaxID=2781959 RepID=A0ABS7Z184_9SPHI|nr:DUF2480 family protein [Sphingobacterium bovistauri]MCA5003928.1 DUF2480 family protein [Sphingobacterium bovistauri]
MEIQENIVNKVAQSGLITIDLANYSPNQEDIIVYDIKENLFHELILREKDFRDFVKEYDWTQYQDKHVGITCSTDAIVPTWAYMILANKLTPFAKSITFGTKEDIIRQQYTEEINAIDYSKYQNERVVVKGCGDIYIPESAFVTFTAKLSTVAKSIMYGEPCSTVPVYKRKS